MEDGAVSAPAAWSSRLLSAAVYGYARADVLAERALQSARQCATGVLHEALTVDEKVAVGVRLYSASPAGEDRTTLFDWERRWFERRLPAAPARILVGAAGAGREAVALVKMGYRVDAFEPAVRPAARCAQRLGDGAEVVAARFEDLSRAVLDGDGDLWVARRRYDAVLLGWGGLTHVLDPDERVRIVAACARLAPEGPILASFWFRGGAPAGRSRGLQLGMAVGRGVRALRGLPAPAHEPLRFAGRYGFGHSFTHEEIEALARGAGRVVEWGDLKRAGYPHATFLCRPPPAGR